MGHDAYEVHRCRYTYRREFLKMWLGRMGGGVWFLVVVIGVGVRCFVCSFGGFGFFVVVFGGVGVGYWCVFRLWGFFFFLCLFFWFVFFFFVLGLGLMFLWRFVMCFLLDVFF